MIAQIIFIAFGVAIVSYLIGTVLAYLLQLLILGSDGVNLYEFLVKPWK